MLEAFISSAEAVLARYAGTHGNLAAASEVLGALHGAALKVHGVRRTVAVSPRVVALVVQGEHAKGEARVNERISLTARTVDVDVGGLDDKARKQLAKDLETALGIFAPLGEGAHVWVVPDGYMAALTDEEKRFERDGTGYFSHEALCVQNMGSKATRCELFVYFEAPSKEVLRHAFDVEPARSIHLRLDKIRAGKGEPFIPKSAPVGYKVVSLDAPVVVQGSRILTSGKQSEFASFGTVMGWTPE